MRRGVIMTGRKSIDSSLALKDFVGSRPAAHYAPEQASIKGSPSKPSGVHKSEHRAGGQSRYIHTYSTKLETGEVTLVIEKAD
jgi:hypothetical protein